MQFRKFRLWMSVVALSLVLGSCGDKRESVSQTLARHDDTGVKYYKISIQGGGFPVYRETEVLYFPGRGTNPPHAHEMKCQTQGLLTAFGLRADAAPNKIVIDANRKSNTGPAKEVLEKWWFLELTGEDNISSARAITPPLDCPDPDNFDMLYAHKDAAGERRLYLKWADPTYSSEIYEVGCTQILDYLKIDGSDPALITDPTKKVFPRGDATKVHDLSCAAGTKARQETCGDHKVGEDFSEAVKDSLGGEAGTQNYLCEATGKKKVGPVACFPGFSATPGGGCEKDCGNVKFGNTWPADLPDKTGTGTYKCVAGGRGELTGVQCTKEGYVRSDLTCVKVKCAFGGRSYEFGDPITDDRSDGTYTRRCKADQSTPVEDVICKDGRKKVGLSCEAKPTIKAIDGKTTIAISTTGETIDRAFQVTYDAIAGGRTIERVALGADDCGTLVSFALNPNEALVYNYKITWGASLLRSCKASIKARSSAAESDPLVLSFQFTKGCPVGEELNAENVCVKKKCSNGVTVGTPWSVTLKEEGTGKDSGSSAYVCSTIVLKTQTSISCNDGFELAPIPAQGEDPNEKYCRPKNCAGDHLHGRTKDFDLSPGPGTYKKLCAYGTSSPVSGTVSCPGGYDPLDTPYMRCRPNPYCHHQGTDYKVGTRLSFDNTEGYVTNTKECRSNGNWDRVVVTCRNHRNEIIQQNGTWIEVNGCDGGEYKCTLESPAKRIKTRPVLTPECTGPLE